MSTPEGKSFWDTVDATMATIRKTADDEHPEDKQGRDDEISKYVLLLIINLIYNHAHTYTTGR